MAKRIGFWVALCLVLGISSVYAQNRANDNQLANTQTAGATAGLPSSATNDPNYVIGPQDILDVDVWKEPEITRTVPVRPDGKISLPLLNDVQAAGLTPTQLSAHITSELKKYITDPQVTVIVSKINSQRVYILGNVARQGGYALLPQMTVLQALSDAGGFSTFANRKGVYVIRQENGKQKKFLFNYDDVVKGKHIDENILLKPGDTIIVP